MSRTQSTLFGTALPTEFVEAFRQLEQEAGLSPVTLTLIDFDDKTDREWVTLSVKVGDSRKSYRLCRRSSEMQRAARDVFEWWTGSTR